LAASAPLTPPPGNPRFPQLDAMRAVAALAIVAYHVAFFSRASEHGAAGAVLSRLSVGVTVFFVISGFVLYRPFARARRAGEPPRPLGDYARRRALRIVPAYWLALTVLAIYPGLTFPHGWWIYYGFLQVYSGATIIGGIGPAWSLCTEVAFYVALPLLAVLLGRVPWRSELWLLGALGLASFGFRAYIELTNGPIYLTQTILGTFDGFALGMGLAVLSVAGREPRGRPALAWAAALLCLLAAAAIAGPDPAFVLTTNAPAGEALAVRALGLATAVFLLLPAMSSRSAAPPRLLAWLGAISYGIFLWHYPIVQRVTVGADMQGFPGGNGWRIAAISLPIVLACAALSYHLLERPLLRAGARRARSPSTRRRAGRGGAARRPR
jgi:peptidoglycan/LPS O-acetylase OafA/YrhL